MPNIFSMVPAAEMMKILLPAGGMFAVAGLRRGGKIGKSFYFNSRLLKSV
jgi:hypothetical protein